MYQITQYTYDKARQLGVQVLPSEKKKYKLDIYDRNGRFITSVGASGYLDYPTYTRERGKDYANERRRLFKIRHEKDRTKVGSRGWFADQLLW